MSLDQQFSSGPSAPLKTQQLRRGGGGWTPPPPLKGAPGLCLAPRRGQWGIRDAAVAWALVRAGGTGPRWFTVVAPPAALWSGTLDASPVVLLCLSDHRRRGAAVRRGRADDAAHAAGRGVREGPGDRRAGHRGGGGRQRCGAGGDGQRAQGAALDDPGLLPLPSEAVGGARGVVRAGDSRRSGPCVGLSPPSLAPSRTPSPHSLSHCASFCR